MSGLQHPESWWLANNPVLGQGQLGQVIDQGTYKIGDGVNVFSSLPYIGLPIVNIGQSFFSSVGSYLSTLTSFCQYIIPGGSIVQEGAWIDFEFIITPTNNSNAKTVYLKFNSGSNWYDLLSFSVATSSAVPIVIEGKIKCTGYKNGNALYKIELKSNADTPVIGIGTFSGVAWTQNTKLVLQGTGVNTNDLVFESGEIVINIIPRL